MNLTNALCLTVAVTAGLFLVSIRSDKPAAEASTPAGFPTPPVAETADVGPPPDLTIGMVKCKCSGDCDCDPCLCKTADACKAKGVTSPVKCGFCAGLGQVKCQPCQGSGYEPYKAPPGIVCDEKGCRPAMSEPDGYMLVRVPYTVRSGFRGRFSRTEYRQEWMLKSEYARRLEASKQPRAYYRGGCSNGSCR